MAKPPTLYEAVAWFLGPLSAEYARIIDDGPDDLEVTISLGGYDHKTTLRAIKDLDRAYAYAFDVKQKKAENRARGTLL